MAEMTFSIGSDNVYADLGYDHPEVMRAKAELVFSLGRLITARGLTHAQAADIVGLPEPALSALLHGHFTDVPLERIFGFLIALDNDVAIVVTPKGQEHGHLVVTAS